MDVYPVGRQTNFPAKLEAFVSEQSLQLEEHELKTRPNSRHWHIRKVGQKGTLEATWDGRTFEAALSTHSNRKGEWIDDMVVRFAAFLDR